MRYITTDTTTAYRVYQIGSGELLYTTVDAAKAQAEVAMGNSVTAFQTQFPAKYS